MATSRSATRWRTSAASALPSMITAGIEGHRSGVGSRHPFSAWIVPVPESGTNYVQIGILAVPLTALEFADPVAIELVRHAEEEALRQPHADRVEAVRLGLALHALGK